MEKSFPSAKRGQRSPATIPLPRPPVNLNLPSQVNKKTVRRSRLAKVDIHATDVMPEEKSKRRDGLPVAAIRPARRCGQGDQNSPTTAPSDMPSRARQMAMSMLSLTN